MKNQIPLVFIVVLNYNGKEALSTCLSSIYQSSYKNFEVVVVDNNSQDGSFEQARHDYSRAHFIKNSINIGFARGNNIGIRFALEKFADYIFVLNNDAVIEKDTIFDLVKEAEDNEKVGILSPVILQGQTKEIWFAGGKILWDKMKTIHDTETLLKNSYESEYITGCAMFIKKNVFKKIGLFDERFFLYYEDADFSLRAKKEGFDLWIVPTCRIKHFEQSTHKNKEKIYWLVLSGLLFFKIHTSGSKKVFLFFYLLLRKLKNYYQYVFKSNDSVIQVRKAYRDFKKIAA